MSTRNEFNDILVKAIWKELKRRSSTRYYDISLHKQNKAIQRLAHYQVCNRSPRHFRLLSHISIKDMTKKTISIGVDGDVVLLIVRTSPPLTYTFALQDPSIFDQLVSFVDNYMKCDMLEIRYRLKIYGWWGRKVTAHERAARLFYKWLLRQK